MALQVTPRPATAAAAAAAAAAHANSINSIKLYFSLMILLSAFPSNFQLKLILVLSNLTQLLRDFRATKFV
jgi:hypothetical protein